MLKFWNEISVEIVNVENKSILVGGENLFLIFFFV